MNKVYPDAKSALAGILKDGMMIMSGGFGLCGIAETLSDAIRDSGVKNLTVVSNNAGVDGIGLSRLLETRQIRKMISSYVGENKLFAQQFLAGELELEFAPQGTLAERIRAGGAGIPAFFTQTGVGTLIAEGKEVREFDGERYLMERGLFADLAIVHAWKGDTAGNLVYRKTARNFNPMMATAAKITVAEVEHLLPAGQIDPDQIHTPGIFVQRHRQVGPRSKRIEQRTTRKARRRPPPERKSDGLDPRSNGGARREGIARRLLRQSRHRHPDAGLQLHPRRRRRRLAERERHARHGAVSLRGRGRPRFDQRRQADRHRTAADQLFFLANSFGMVRGGHIDLSILGAHAGGAERRSRQLDDPRQDGEGDGRRDGPGRRRQARASW